MDGGRDGGQTSVEGFAGGCRDGNCGLGFGAAFGCVVVWLWLMWVGLRRQRNKNSGESSSLENTHYPC